VGFRHRVRGVEADQPGPVLPVLPAPISADHAQIHPPPQELAVPNVNRLGDHVGVRVLRDGCVDQPRMVLGVDVLLDPTTRASDSDGVLGDPVRGDETVLDHDRGLATELEVVVLAGLVPGRVDNRIPAREAVVVEGRTPARVALVVPDAHAALEGVDEALVPRGEVRAVRLRLRREHGDRVDEAVDRAALPPDDEVDFLPVRCRRLRHVGGARSGGVVVHERTRGVAVLERDDAVGRARGAIGDRTELGIAAVPVGGAPERRLLRAGEHRPGDRVVGQGQGRGCRSATVAGTDLDRVLTHDQAVDDSLELALVDRLEGASRHAPV